MDTSNVRKITASTFHHESCKGTRIALTAHPGQVVIEVAIRVKYIQPSVSQKGDT